eukprot:scaffold808_cov196-Alexandrium_tamarense.AAC.21
MPRGLCGGPLYVGCKEAERRNGGVDLYTGNIRGHYILFVHYRETTRTDSPANTSSHRTATVRPKSSGCKIIDRPSRRTTHTKMSMMSRAHKMRPSASGSRWAAAASSRNTSARAISALVNASSSRLQPAIAASSPLVSTHIHHQCTSHHSPSSYTSNNSNITARHYSLDRPSSGNPFQLFSSSGSDGSAYGQSLEISQWPISKTNTIINIVPQGKRMVVERFGKLHAIHESGFFIAVPIVDRIAYVIDVRERAVDIAPQSAITRDNVSVEVSGNLFVRVVDPERAAYGARNPLYAVMMVSC